MLLKLIRTLLESLSYFIRIYCNLLDVNYCVIIPLEVIYEVTYCFTRFHCFIIFVVFSFIKCSEIILKNLICFVERINYAPKKIYFYIIEQIF